MYGKASMQYLPTSLFPIGVIQLDLSAYYTENHAYCSWNFLAKHFLEHKKRKKKYQGNSQAEKNLAG